MFNTNNFLNSTYRTETSTELLNVPEGTWPGVVTELKPRISKTKNGDRPMLDVTFTITDPEVLAAIKRDKGTVRKSCWLDLASDGESLDMSPGKNVDIGRLREAFGQNDASKSWSPNDFMGQAGQVVVKHRIDSTTNKVYTDVAEVLPL